MKRIISLILITVFLISSASAVDLYVDMDKVETDTPPTTVDGRTLVPLRAIFEAIGATVEWNNETRTATGIKEDTSVSIQINSTTAYVNGEPHTLDVPAQVINDRTMVPARFISESMGCDVTWDQETKTAAVANNLKGRKLYAAEGESEYHYSEICNGNTYNEITLAQTVGRRLTACAKCVLSEDTSENNSEQADEFLFAKESVRFYYTGYTKNENGYIINLRIENDSDYMISGYIGPDSQVGNKKVDMRLSFNAEPGRTVEGTITITSENLEKAGITDFKTIKAMFTIFDARSSNRMLDFSTGFITIRLKK